MWFSLTTYSSNFLHCNICSWLLLLRFNTFSCSSYFLQCPTSIILSLTFEELHLCCCFWCSDVFRIFVDVHVVICNLFMFCSSCFIFCSDLHIFLASLPLIFFPYLSVFSLNIFFHSLLLYSFTFSASFSISPLSLGNSLYHPFSTPNLGWFSMTYLLHFITLRNKIIFLCHLGLHYF